jgi:hypothetical protein
MKKIIAYSCLFLIILSSSLSCVKSGSKGKFPYYFSGTVNSQNVKYEADDINSQYSCSISFPYTGSGLSYDIYEGTSLENQNDPYKNEIEVLLLQHFNHYPDQTERKSMIQLGNYGYGVGNVGTGINTVNGAVVRYLDTNGTEWSSEDGTQTGSTFKITELINNSSGFSAKIFTAQFSCKIYNTSGASIEIKNATIRGKAFLP